MGQFTVEQRVHMVKTFLETKDYDEVIRSFVQRYPNRAPPSKTSIYRNVKKYERNGTSLNLNKGNSGRRRTGRSAVNIQLVRAAFTANPNLSTRRNGLNLPQTTVNRIIRLDLRLYPYKIHVRHELKPQDFGRRVAFCNWFLGQCHNNRFLHNFVIGDEASFSMNGKVSTHTVRQYAPKGQQPSFNYDVNLSREKLNVWAGLCGNGAILGPFFFQRNITGRTYLDMINQDIIPALLPVYGLINENQIANIWWAQDGAPAHRKREVIQRLDALFQNNLIALGHQIEWPPRSPDLTPMDFFVWGYVKNKVYVTPPRNLQDLRQRISDEFVLMRQQGFVANAFRGMERRATLCVQKNGRHVEGF